MKIPSFKIETPAGLFHVSGGNNKVFFPIVNVGAAMDCPSRKWCPFDLDNHKEAGRAPCYAQASERQYETALESRRNNERIIRELDSFDTGVLALDIATMIVEKTTRKQKRTGDESPQFVRINESSDLAPWNIDFCRKLVLCLKSAGIGVYLYSKAPRKLRAEVIGAGAKVLHSEHDFVAFGNQAELDQSTAIPCPGKCGPCTACPQFDGRKIGIVEH